jgi:hypothetical protein
LQSCSLALSSTKATADIPLLPLTP